MSRRFVSISVLLVALVSVSGISPQARAETVSFPTFGVSLAPPDHSSFKLANGSRQLALYEFDKTSPFAGAVIQIEALPTKGASLDDLAASIAKERHGQPAGEQFSIGGERAAKLLESFTDHGRAITCLVVHGDMLYSFRAIIGPTMDIAKTLSAFLQSVKFTAIDGPVDHLKEFSSEPFKILGIFTIPGPICMRIDAKSDAQVFLPIRDLRDQSEDFVVNIQTLQTPPEKTFADIRDPYAKGLAAQLHSELPKFQPQKGMPGLNISQAVQGEFETKDGQKFVATNRFCMLDRGQGRFVQILFTIQAKTPADTKAYVDLSDRMLAGIKILPNAPTTKP